MKGNVGCEPSPKARRSAYLGLLVVLLCALLVRDRHLVNLDRDWVLFRVPVVDASEYDQEARERATGAYRYRVPIHGVLYPIVLGAAYELTEGEPLAVRRIQLGIALLTWILVAWLGERLVGLWPAVVGAALLALYRPALLFDSELYAEGTTGLVLFVSVWLMVRALSSRRFAWTLGAGFACGLAMIARSNLALLLPVFAVARLHVRTECWRRRALRSLAFVAMALLPVLPVTIANHLASGEWVFLQARGGHNLFMANHPDARDGTPSVRPGPVFETFRRRPRVEAGAVGPTAESTFYRTLFWNSVQEHPLRFLRGLWWKVEASLSPVEVPSSYDPELQARFSDVARWPLPGFGFLLPFLIVGLWAPGRDPRATFVLLATLIVVWASLGLGFAAGRYRHQASPLLWLVGGVGITRVVSAVRHGLRRPRRMATWRPLALLGIGVVITFLAPRFEERQVAWAAEADQFLAYGHWVRWRAAPAGSARGLRELALAREAVERAVERDPELPLAHYTLGLIAEVGRDGRREGVGSNPERALTHYAEALRVWPSYPEAHENRGRIFARTGRLEAAIAEYERAVAIQPERSLAWETLARLYDGVGRPRDAAAARARFDTLLRAE